MRWSPSERIVVLRLPRVPSGNFRHDFTLLFLQLGFSHQIFTIGLILQQGRQRIFLLAFVKLLFASLTVAVSNPGETPSNCHRSTQEQLPAFGTTSSFCQTERSLENKRKKDGMSRGRYSGIALVFFPYLGKPAWRGHVLLGNEKSIWSQTHDSS